MSKISISLSLGGVVIISLIASNVITARTLNADPITHDIGSPHNLAYTPPLPVFFDPSTNAMATEKVLNMDQVDSDGDDDDDDDMRAAYEPRPVATGNSNQPILVEDGTKLAPDSYQPLPAASADLKTSASHHHHGHGAKGWLDMGAWTGKKGAFGWYDKHPVGKGK